MDKKALADYFAVVTAGGRQSGEKSRAVESRYYGYGGDPANHIEYEAEVARKEKVKQEARKEKGRKLKKQKQSKHQYTRKLKGG